MTIKIILSVIFGILSGIFLLPASVLSELDGIVTMALYLLVFWVGVDIGSNEEVFGKIKELGIKILLIPLVVGAGSIAGAMLFGLLFKMPLNESGAVGAGMGWYSLSAVIITNLHSAKLGAIAFLSNVARELIAIVSIPLIAEKIGHLEAIGPSGATGMDTTMPIVAKATSPDMVIISFITGVCLSSSVPILVPLFF